RYKGPGTPIKQDCVRPGVVVRTFNRAGPDLTGHTCLTKARAKIITDEVPHLCTCPHTGGELLVGVRLILDVKLLKRESLCLIRLYVTQQVQCVCLKNPRFPSQHTIVVDAWLLHPG